VAIVALVVALVVAGAAWFVVLRPSDSSGSASSSAASTPGAHAATVAGLRAASAALGHPIFWAGARPGMTYELTVTKQKNAYVRYLTAGVKPGDPRPNFVTVGTYPKTNAYGVLTSARTIKNARVQSFGNNELAVSYPNRPNSVYVAQRGSNFMVEVFAPASRGAETLVRSGLIVPVK
jgi:hypothetical protein